MHHALCKGIELHVFGVENKLSKQDQQLKGYAEAAARNEAIADEKAEKLKDFARGADDPDEGVLSHEDYVREANNE